MIHKQVLLAQTRGKVADGACTRCLDDGGLFRECVLLDGYFGGGCANCFITRTPSNHPVKCSLRTRERIAAAIRTRQELYPKRPSANEKCLDISEDASRLKKAKIIRDPGNVLPISPTQVASLGTELFPETGETVILGMLKLSNPASCGASHTIIEHIKSVLQDLRALDARDLSGLSHDVDLRTDFHDFVNEEIRAWSDEGSKLMDAGELVKPSGSLDSPIAHHLHQPSFTTDGTHGQETADFSNGCIAMVMGNAFTNGKTLIFDHIHRRQTKSEGLEKYPRRVIDVHETFRRSIMAYSAAKVEIVYGQPVQKRILETMRCTPLPLWGELEGVIIFLVHEDNFFNQDKRYKYRKCLLFATHPQRFFNEQERSFVTVKQDLTFEVASRILGEQIHNDPDYYRLRKWRSKIVGNSEQAFLRAKQHLDQDLSLQEIPSSDQSLQGGYWAPWKKLDSQDGIWYQYFDDAPYSNQTTRAFLPAAIEAARVFLQDAEGDWHSPEDFPQGVLNWFKGQKEVLFYYGPVSCLGDLEQAVSRICSTKRDKNQLGLACVIHTLMVLQQTYLETHAGQNDDLYFSRIDGKAIRTICPCGMTIIEDEHPRFACRSPQHYLMRASRLCKSSHCDDRSRSKRSLSVPMRPTSPDLRGVSDSRKNLLAASGRTENDSYLKLLRPQEGSPEHPTTVEIWCCRCRERSVLQKRYSHQGGGIHTDTDARWTYGDHRPLYLGPTSQCRNCDSGRLVPVDSNVPFLDRRILSNIQTNYGRFDLAIRSAILDNLPSCSHFSRRDI